MLISCDSALLGNSSVKNLSAEEASLGLFDNLLVHVVRWVVHDDSAVLRINLGIEASIADQVDNPLLAIVGVEAELSGEITDVHAREDLAIAFAD